MIQKDKTYKIPGTLETEIQKEVKRLGLKKRNGAGKVLRYWLEKGRRSEPEIHAVLP